MIEFIQPPNCHSRTFEVKGAMAPITCQLSYIGEGNAYRGGAMDAQVMPLILAAPEMLKALQRITHPMSGDDDLEYALEVIAKATGKKV